MHVTQQTRDCFSTAGYLENVGGACREGNILYYYKNVVFVSRRQYVMWIVRDSNSYNNMVTKFSKKIKRKNTSCVVHSLDENDARSVTAPQK